MQTLSNLAHFRRRGQSPALPVYVTDIRTLADNLRGCGAMVVLATVDAPHWDWRPVAGLEVILALVKTGRELAEAVKAANPRRLLAVNWDATNGEKLTAVLV
jgi:hypothetical protein